MFKKMFKKIIEKLLFKKKDYGDFIITKVESLTKLDLEIQAKLEKLKSDPDACTFDSVLSKIEFMKFQLEQLEKFEDVFPSIVKYTNQMNETIKGYDRTTMLLAYGARFK